MLANGEEPDEEMLAKCHELLDATDVEAAVRAVGLSAPSSSPSRRHRHAVVLDRAREPQQRAAAAREFSHGAGGVVAGRQAGVAGAGRRPSELLRQQACGRHLLRRLEALFAVFFDAHVDFCRGANAKQGRSMPVVAGVTHNEMV